MDTMPSHEHTKLTKRITSLDTLPEEPSEYANWIEAAGHLGLLRDNAMEDELGRVCHGSTHTHTRRSG